ncbi:MAG: ABC transporter permease [Lachnospiraceae bacterium]|nr:ABC transporter permease [Lachnospiraceae bacterium]
MFENISLAFQGIWSHKLRSCLTMLGIIIGIASIISIVSTIKGTNEQIKENLIGSGNNAVNVQLYQGDDAYDLSWSSLPEGVPVISEETRQELEDLDEVEVASLYTSRSYAEYVYYQNTSYSGSMYGIDSHYFDVYGYYVQWGRDFTEEDFASFRKVAILDRDAVSSLYWSEENPVGTTLEIYGEPFTVIGIVDQSSSFEPVIDSLGDYYTYMNTTGGQIFLTSAAWSIVYNLDEPQSAVLRAVDTDSMTGAGNKAAEILNAGITASSDENYSYKSEDLLEQAKQLQDLSSSTNQQLIWIASISLLVGGIGVMNIMLVSVTERTREIGLKKAIGAKKRQIRVQFLTEAAVLTSLGGILGVVVGVIMATAISRLTSTPTAISVPASLAAVVFSMAIGILFGLFPAMKAANLNPIDALRHE